MAQKIIRGKNWRFPDNVDTDQVYPGRYLSLSLPEELAARCMEGARHPRFRQEVKPGDLIVAGKNFGCGSSREHAARSIKYLGIQAIVAESFARIFFRNAFSLGLPLVEAPGVSEIEEGNEIEVNLESGEVKDLSSGKTYQGTRIPPFLLEMIEKGGLLPQLEDRFLKQK